MNEPHPKVQIHLRTFASIRQVLGAGSISLELPANTTITQLLQRLCENQPELSVRMEHIVVTVNQQYVDRSMQLQHGDEVAIFPPVSGGSDESYVAISPDPIDVSSLIELVTEPGAGAVVTFAGVVRDNNLGRSVDYLEYEAYTEMAEAKLLQVINEARERWPKIRRVAAVHRVGHLDLGETAALIAVGAPHREDGAFEAARFAIDRIKEIVPIWKKEGWSDGTEWLAGDYQPMPGE
jgi:molybdopterin synthase catalytic subunit